MPASQPGNMVRMALVVWAVAALLLGLEARALGRTELSQILWTIGTMPVLFALLVDIVSSLRRGDVGLDLVAALSMTAALLAGEELAAVVVALMYSGGQYLENYAEMRARHEMTALLSRVPRIAIRHADGALQEVPLDEIAPADVLLVRHGDVVPTDGVLASGTALLDQAALTGESIPVRHHRGAELMSGAINVGDPFDITATRRAAESTLAGIVRLVAEAQQVRAPMVRLADRFAIGFLLLTIAIAAAAWYWTGDMIRAVAVLVVATPCPLILAVPVALVSGLSRAAREGVLIKGGRILEAMAKVRVLVLDKTGTLTSGQAHLVDTLVAASIPANEMLRLAASLDQISQHSIANALVVEAQSQGLVLSVPQAARETAGEGVVGEVDGHTVALGGRAFVAGQLPRHKAPATYPETRPGSVCFSLAVDGVWVGELVLVDTLRSGSRAMLDGLRAIGIRRIVLATGDRLEVAKAVVAGLGLDAINAGLAPEEKIAVVQREKALGPVVMIGDGVNDAPALAAADVGVAMGARGTAASAEVADVVLLVDRLDPILPGLKIARAARRIALQSVFAGLSLSIVGMIAAAFGALTPVQGALLQEVIDIAVILNALRALRIRV